MAITQFEKDREEYIKAHTPKVNQQISDRVAGINQIVDATTNQAVAKVQGEIDKLPTAYQSAYDTNAIQQKINERQAAERMANLGLTDSGLNRSQQTAFAIQRSNADAAITQQKMAVSASLKQQIADLYASGELNKMQNQMDIHNTYMDNLESGATSYATEQASNRAAIEKARIEAQQKQAEQYTKWALDNGGYYDESGALIPPTVSGGSPAFGKTSFNDTQYEDILNLYVEHKGYSKDPTEFAKKVLEKYPNYNMEEVKSFINQITMSNNGGTNYGDWFLGWWGNGGIDQNGEIAYGDNKNITMQKLYERLKKIHGEDKAKKLVMDFQHHMGI